jgi:hypothetical protein
MITNTALTSGSLAKGSIAVFVRTIVLIEPLLESNKMYFKGIAQCLEYSKCWLLKRISQNKVSKSERKRIEKKNTLD